MLSFKQFTRDLEEFVDLYSKTDAEAVFKLHESSNQIYAEQRQVIDDPRLEKRVHRLISILYSEAYLSPVLWFNFYDSNGKLLYLEEFEPFLSKDSAGAEILKGLSQNEHPIHGIAFYNIHPCKTNEFMKNFITRNYITSWLSVYGAIVGLDMSKVVKSTFS
ncbi:Autophagy-act-C domain-containing protein [Aphelenchoides bicaudatus]|nr:Autophagy-act-C domain-containing protein [Aphelenchoides bicaudatus]